MVSDLLPCPFCGGEAGIDRPGTMRASMKISCSNCGATVESGDVLGLTSPEAFAWNRRAEALSRTGAVKVKALEWEERKTRLGTVWWSAPNPLGGLSIEAASENDKIAAQADFEHRILSALEPAATCDESLQVAPEARQDDEPVAWRVTYASGEVVFLSDKPVGEYVYDCEPLFARPVSPTGRWSDYFDNIRDAIDGCQDADWDSEQAAKSVIRTLDYLNLAPPTPASQTVTEAMVEAAAISLRPDLFTPLDPADLRSDDFAWTRRKEAKANALHKARSALKAAMEAGRHD